MLKRLMISFLVLLMIYSAFVVGFRLFEPEKEEIYQTSLDTTVVDYASARNYTLSSGASSVHCYFFCSPQNDDCTYMENTVMRTVENDTGVRMSEIFEYIDVTALESTNDLNRLKEEWGLDDCPGFVLCHVQDQEIIIDSTLSWDSSRPLSVFELKQWLRANNLYDARENETEIEQPVS